MFFKLYDDVNDFSRDVKDVLLRDEAQNFIPLGNIMLGCAGLDKTGWRDPANWLMATVSDGSKVRLTAIMTPPHSLTLYAAGNVFSDAELVCLINGIKETSYQVGGVNTNETLAVRFAEIYCGTCGASYKVDERLRTYELTEVNPDIRPVGLLRPARDSDLSFLPFWIEGFGRDCFGGLGAPVADEGRYRYEIEYSNRYIYEHMGTPVSMARAHREMVNACGVGGVYTPPYFRGKGYATACVAAVSRMVLGRGFKSCVLNADLANPTSNGIYQKIGYRPVCDAASISFKTL